MSDSSGKEQLISVIAKAFNFVTIGAQGVGGTRGRWGTGDGGWSRCGKGRVRPRLVIIGFWVWLCHFGPRKHVLDPKIAPEILF